MMLDLLKPFEAFFHANLPPGPLRQMLFELFRVMHLYLYEYPDYLLFGLAVIPPYFLAPRRYRPAYLLAASAIFLGLLYGWAFAAGMTLFPLFIHWLTGRLAPRAQTDAAFRRRASFGLWGLVLSVYGLLLARESAEWAPVIPLFGRTLAIPLLHICGVAFMLPKLLHYISDRLSGKIGTASARDVLLFLLFFPTLRLGPIERFQNFSRDLRHAEQAGISAFDVGYGLYRILLGVLKTVIYAAFLYPDRAAQTPFINDLPAWTLYWHLLAGVLEVYCHFGGYTDIAIGFSRLVGFRMMENFYLPFFSENIGEWWRRWHISLSFWLRDYVYRPLGGNRKNGFINGLITFVICGAWHYLAWNYIIWGAAQGVGIAGWMVWRRFWRRVGEKAGYHDGLKPLVGWMHAHPRTAHGLAILVTLHYFCLTGIFFILDVDNAWLLFRRVVTLGYFRL
ncbi:MAG: MBOAT family protein [Myxococcales bacterium]|nr:MAG: MBOAT family protein [Myxococcales bacterium]